MRLTAFVLGLPILLLVGCDSLTEPSEFRVVKENAPGGAAPPQAAPPQAAPPQAKGQADAPKAAADDAASKPGSATDKPTRPERRAPARDPSELRAKRAGAGADTMPAAARGGSCGD